MHVCYVGIYGCVYARKQSKWALERPIAGMRMYASTPVSRVLSDLSKFYYFCKKLGVVTSFKPPLRLSACLCVRVCMRFEHVSV